MMTTEQNIHESVLVPLSHLEATRTESDNRSEKKERPAPYPSPRKYAQSSQTNSIQSQRPQEGHSFWFIPNFLRKSDIDIAAELCSVETLLLSKINFPYQQLFVDAGSHQINTIKMGEGSPIVLWHGFGAGIAFWQRNLRELSQHHTVYAIDLPGFGRSSRTPTFESMDPESAEEYFLSALEDWCVSLQLTNFVLLGHSFGAYLASCFALKHPKRIKKLILADPWGIPETPANVTKSLNLRWTAISNIARVIDSPFSAVRSVGHYYGPRLINAVRPDLERKWGPESGQEGLITRYLYLLNATVPATGERAFFRIATRFGYSLRPLFDRLLTLPESIPVFQLYGEFTWMDKMCGSRLNDMLGPRAKMCIIKDSGHHIYCDNAPDFNKAVLYASIEDNSLMPKPAYF